MRRLRDALLLGRVSDAIWVSISLGVLLVVAYYSFLYTSATTFLAKLDPSTWKVRGLDPAWVGDASMPQLGDQILSIDGVTIEEYSSSITVTLLPDWPSKRAATLNVVRDGKEIVLVVPLAEREWSWSSGATAAWIFPGIFWFMGTTAVIFLRPREERWIVLVTCYYTVAIWSSAGFSSFARTAYSGLILHCFVWFFLPLIFHLHMILPDSLWNSRYTYAFVLWPLYIISAIMTVLDLTMVAGPRDYYYSVILGGIVALGLLVLRMIKGMAVATPVSRANRLILFGSVLGLGPIIYYLIFRPPDITPFASGAVIALFPLWPFSYIYALYRPDLGTVEYRPNRFLATYSFYALYILLYVTVFNSLVGFTGDGTVNVAIALSTSLVFVALAPTLKSRYQRLVDRYVFGIKYSAQELVGIFSRKIPAANNRKILKKIILDDLLPTLMIRQSLLGIFTRSESGEWSGIEIFGAQAEPEELPPDCQDFLLSKAKSFIPPGTLRVAELEWIRLIVPLAVQDEVVGVWLLGRRDPDDFYSKEDIELLSSLAGQIAPVIENFRLVEIARQEVEENKKLQKQLLHSQKMEAIGSLSAGVAHDFNNLLSVILGNSYLLLEDYEHDVELSRFLGEIRDAGEKASSLTRQLLTFSRQGTMEVLLVDLNDVVDSITQMLAVMAGKAVELFVEMGEDLPPVRVDPDQMSQVIINLTVNARDAMPGGGEVRVRTSRFELVAANPASEEIGMPLGRYVLLQISDNGTGIDPEVRSRIFEPFFTTKEPGKGTGLGLSMVYGIVKQCKGYIHLDSEVGRGTTFNIFLPAVEDEVLVEPRLDDTIGEALKGTETILLVEDEDSVREVARTILRANGYDVLTAGSGPEALDVATRTEGKISLLLTDVIMPGMRGPELARHLAGQVPDLKVLYMSGYHDESMFEGYVKGHEPAMIEKPFSPAALARKVREVLDTHESVAGQLVPT